MVAGYYAFVLVREGGEEVDGVLKLGWSAVGAYVTGVDEDIAIRDVAWVERVRI